MKAITVALDSILQTKLDDYDACVTPDPVAKLWGLAELMTKNEERFPVTVNSRKTIKLDEAYDIIIFHRIAGDTQGLDEETETWGVRTQRRVITPLRTILAHKITVGEDFRYKFTGFFPKSIKLTLNQFVHFDFVSIGEYHEQIARDEWPDAGFTQYGKHRVPWNICTINYNVSHMECEEVCEL